MKYKKDVILGGQILEIVNLNKPDPSLSSIMIRFTEGRRGAGLDVDGGVAEHRGADGGAQRRVPVNQKRERLGD